MSWLIFIIIIIAELVGLWIFRLKNLILINLALLCGYAIGKFF